jgi:hypothetical protein
MPSEPVKGPHVELLIIHRRSNSFGELDTSLDAKHLAWPDAELATESSDSAVKLEGLTLRAQDQLT